MSKVSTGTVGLAMVSVKSAAKETRALKQVAMATCCQNQY